MKRKMTYNEFLDSLLGDSEIIGNYATEYAQYCALYNNQNNNMITVKVKKLHKDAVIPSYAKIGDAGMDLTVISRKMCTQESLEDGSGYIQYGTGLAMEIPEGYVGLIFPRSSVTNKSMMLKNCVGIIDSIYRGEIMLRFLVNSNYTYNTIYEVGERAAQIIIMPYPSVQMVESDELSETSRGTGGYGSTGK